MTTFSGVPYYGASIVYRMRLHICKDIVNRTNPVFKVHTTIADYLLLDKCFYRSGLILHQPHGALMLSDIRIIIAWFLPLTLFKTRNKWGSLRCCCKIFWFYHFWKTIRSNLTLKRSNTYVLSIIHICVFVHLITFCIRYMEMYAYSLIQQKMHISSISCRVIQFTKDEIT